MRSERGDGEEKRPGQTTICCVRMDKACFNRQSRRRHSLRKDSKRIRRLDEEEHSCHGVSARVLRLENVGEALLRRIDITMLMGVEDGVGSEKSTER